MTTSHTVNHDGEIIVWKTPYNHDTHREATRTGLACTDPTKAQQSAKDEADINTIVDRFLKTGLAPQVQVPPTYGDFTGNPGDYHDMQNYLAEVNGLFYKLPAALRASYQNDPGQWLNDVNERLAAGDLEPLREMGLQLPQTAADTPNEPGTPPTPQAPVPPDGAPSAPQS